MAGDYIFPSTHMHKPTLYVEKKARQRWAQKPQPVGPCILCSTIKMFSVQNSGLSSVPCWLWMNVHMHRGFSGQERFLQVPGPVAEEELGPEMGSSKPWASLIMQNYEWDTKDSRAKAAARGPLQLLMLAERNWENGCFWAREDAQTRCAHERWVRIRLWVCMWASLNSEQVNGPPSVGMGELWALAFLISKSPAYASMH